jgi:hypothetical protein
MERLMKISLGCDAARKGTIIKKEVWGCHARNNCQDQRIGHK